MNHRYLRFSIAMVGFALSLPSVADVAKPAPDLAQVRQRMSALTVPFVPNAGQWDARAAFAARTFAGTLFVTTAGQLVYSLPGGTRACVGREGAARCPARVAR
ncbi:MAG: hypothetical protein IPO58_21200 [Betaproteobacteria bacterium]|nr:hypothetical protein [Betaproteobacteria bacterium]